MCSSVRAAFLSGVIDRLARRNERIRPLKLTELRVLSWDDGCRGSLLAFSLFFHFSVGMVGISFAFAASFAVAVVRSK